MEAFFTLPGTMIAGAALISSPIIIHLINRLRYRRVRWAAMEFLLKSQKRNRRRVILEQLLLLLLRILIVLVLGFLLARFLGFDPSEQAEARATVHVIVVDDTPSMTDTWRQDGQLMTSYDLAKKQIVESIAQTASRANAAQELYIIRLSELRKRAAETTSEADQTGDYIPRLDANSVENLRVNLDDDLASPVHTGLLGGIEEARKILEERGDRARVIHVVSDFRSADWTGPEQESLQAKFEELSNAKITVHLVDVAHPERVATSPSVLANDNLAIVDLRPSTRVAAQYQPVEFTVDVANFSNAEKKNVRISVKRNGEERAEASTNIASLPPGQVTSATFTLALERLGTRETPLERFNLVSTHIEQEEAGLRIDNVRFAYVEVRERVPVLIVEGDSAKSNTTSADGYYLASYLNNGLDGYDVVVRGESVLEQPNLRQYAAIYVCNVGELSAKATTNLEEYARGGGGVAFFMGPRVRPEFYNQLYDDGQGLFPVPLAEQPSTRLSDEERTDRLFSFQMQIFPRDETHPALARIYLDELGKPIADKDEYNRFLRIVVINQYWPVDRLKWRAAESRAAELMSFPNYGQVGDYLARLSQEPGGGVTPGLLYRLPMEDQRYQEFRKGLEFHQGKINRIANSTQPLYDLANAVEDFLTDTGVPDDENRPNLQPFWQAPEIAPLRQEFQSLLEEIRYGDPLYVVKDYGAGRVAAYMTTANDAWNDLDGRKGAAYFDPILKELQLYLASAGVDVNLAVGQAHQMRFNTSGYTPQVKRWYMSEQAAELAGTQAGGAEPSGNTPAFIEEQGEQFMDRVEVPQEDQQEPKEEHHLNLTDVTTPGVYLFEFATIDPRDPAKTIPEYKALTFNVDAAMEGNLRRVGRDDLLQTADGASLHTASEDWAEVLNPQPRDWSEGPWLFLLLLVFLVAEQAMAVRLSFHSHGAE